MDDTNAFPIVVPSDFQDVYYGMLLRDWFAGQAMAACITSDTTFDRYDPQRAAKLAYMFADAMLVERRK
jgi:hypothetical protein